MSEKIKQYKTKLTCECPGYPAYGKEDGRVKCGKKTDIEMGLGQSFMQNRRTIAADLEKKGWRKLRTLGNFQSFCPSCAKIIITTRAEMKKKWG